MDVVLRADQVTWMSCCVGCHHLKTKVRYSSSDRMGGPERRALIEDKLSSFIIRQPGVIFVSLR